MRVDDRDLLLDGNAAGGLLGEIFAAEMTAAEGRCAACGADAEPLPRTELWAVKHRHPKNHSGFVRFYCAEHTPRVPAPAPVAVAPVRARRAPAAERAPRRPSVTDAAPRAMCPDCFVEVSATGECGMCGLQVA